MLTANCKVHLRRFPSLNIVC